MTADQRLAGDQVKACCAASYAPDAVSMLVGDTYHPGGVALTRRFGRAIGLSAGEAVLDVAAANVSLAAVKDDA